MPGMRKPDPSRPAPFIRKQLERALTAERLDFPNLLARQSRTRDSDLIVLAAEAGEAA